MVGCFSFPANQKSSKTVMPRVRSLHYPASCFSVEDAKKRRLSPATDVGSNSSEPHLVLGIRVVVSFVQAQVLGPNRDSFSRQRDCIKNLAHHPFVMDVSACQKDRERDSSAVRPPHHDFPGHPTAA